MDSLRGIIQSSEPLLLFLVIGLGFIFGQIRIRGFKLGVAGVLFVGLFFGAWRPDGTEPLAISHQVMQVGLILFVYTVGLTSGAGFFASIKLSGIRFNIALLLSLIGGTVATIVVGKWMNLSVGEIAGIFCGGLTNTPALASVGELMQNSGIGDARDAAVGYSVAYPFGILGGMLAFQIFAWVYRKQCIEERKVSDSKMQMKTSLSSMDFEVSNPELFEKPIGELRVQENVGLIISRHKHEDSVHVPTKYSVLHEGDVVRAVGSTATLEKAESFFGAKSHIPIKDNESRITMRRILISNKALAGRTIEEIELDRRFNAQITRLRRADVDFIPDYVTKLQLGDRVRVVMPTERAAEVAKFLGDSERSVSDLDYTALTLGISLGVLLGMIPIPIPGGAFVSLGFAGGPLVAGLILGKLGRTGPLVWLIPEEANQALRHIGLLFFLAAVGVVAGGRFLQALMGNGLQLVSLGFITTTLTTTMTLLLLRYYGKATVIEAIGATSGMQTQPATLARAYEMSKSDDTYIAYATTYPVAMVGKILFAQLIVIIVHAMT